MSRKSRENKLKANINELVGKSEADMSTVAETVETSKLESMKAEAEKVNKERGTAKGTRVKVASTRGKNPQPISFEFFDESIPESLPADVQEFVNLTKVSDDKQLLSFLIDGFNSQAYSAASDPIAEYVNPIWPADVQTQFRNAVRSYAKAAGVEIEDAAALIRPGLDKKYAK